MKDNKNTADEALDNFTDWLLDELLKGGFYMDSIPCPNCDGDMDLDEDGRVFRCAECGYTEDAALRQPPPKQIGDQCTEEEKQNDKID